MLSIFSKKEKLGLYVNRRAMRALPLFKLCVFLATLSAAASVPPATQVVQIGQLKVGDRVDSRAAGAPRRVARFYFYLLRSDLPARCLNLQCGRFARKFMMRNGFLVGGGDKELAKDVGLDENTFGVDHSLLIVTDRSGKVIRLFENVASENLDSILERFGSP